MNNSQKVYLVWKRTDDSVNFWPAPLEELLGIYSSKENAISKINLEKKNVKYDIMPLLHCVYHDSFLKVKETGNNSFKLYDVTYTYGDITVSFYIKEQEIDK